MRKANDPTVAEMLIQCRAMVANPPSRETVLDDSGRARLAAYHLYAAGLTGLIADDAVLTHQDSWPPDVLQAMRRLDIHGLAPTTPRGLFAHLSDAQRAMRTSQVKGYVFEQHVADRLNDGSLGPLPDGADHAQLAEAVNQPGWDIELLKQGSVVGHYQVKATDHWQIIAHHLAAHPNVPDVIATTEIAQTASGHHLAANVHVTDGQWQNSDLTSHVGDSVDHITALHAAHEVVPMWALGAIITVGTGQILLGDQDPRVIARQALHQAKEAGYSSAARVATLIALHNPPAAAVAGIGTRLVRTRIQAGQRMATTLRQLRTELSRLRAESAAELIAP